MNRFASTRSEKRASQPDAGWAQWSVGSIEDDGMRYGLTTNALTSSTIATAPTIVTSQSTVTRIGSGSPRVRRSTGFRECRRGRGGDGGARRPAGARPSRETRRRVLGGGRPARSRRSSSGRGSGGRVRSRRQLARRRRPRAASRARRCRSSDAPEAALLAAPTLDLPVVAGEQDLGDLPAAVGRGPGVVRVLEASVELGREALVLARPLGERARAAGARSRRGAPSRAARRRRARTGRSRPRRCRVAHDPVVEALEPRGEQRELALGGELLDEPLGRAGVPAA